MKHILFIVGSLRRESYNLQLAKQAEQFFQGKAEIKYLAFADMPYMNQDIEFPAPAVVQRVRDEMQKADGVWIFTPEYNSSYPGLLKNLLDWLSRPLKPNDYANPTAISGKPVTVSGAAGKSGCKDSMTKLMPLLEMMRTRLMKEPAVGIALTPEAWQTGVLALSDEQIALLQLQAEAFVRFIEE
jgi:NAD(P)H-dependent FMN reductase